MSKGIDFTIKNLDKWEAWLKTLDQGAVDDCKSRILRTAGLRGLEYAQDLTPRRSSRLAGSLSFGAKDNYFKLKIGKTSYVAYGSNVEYAAAINDGFTQRKGRFVPGFWQGDTFHYVKGYETGMVLTGAVIEGAHMFEKSLDYLEGDLDEIAEFEFRRLYAELFK